MADVTLEMIDAAEANIRADHRAGKISKEQFQKELLIVTRARQQANADTPPQQRERVSDTPSEALEAPLNSFEIEVLEMLAGKRDGQWGAWVGAVLGTLSGRGLCTRGPNYQITDSGRAALEASHD